MNENHKLEKILSGIAGEGVPADIHQLAEDITDEFRRGLSAGNNAIPQDSTDAALAATQAAAQLSDDSIASHAPTQPTVRLVPDVPTELADGVSRETYPILQPPSRRHVPRRLVAMFHSKSARWLAAAAVAAAVLLTINFWPGKAGRGGPGSAFAAAIEQFEKAKTIVCRITTSVSAGAVPIQQTGKVYMSAEYGTRCEMLMNGTPMLTQYSPLQGPSTIVTPATRTYAVTNPQAAGEQGHGPQGGGSPDCFIRALSKLKGQATRELGRETVDGIDALGYEIAGQLLGLGSGEGVRSELWVDANTYLPVRYMAEVPMAASTGINGATMRMVYDQFEWDTPLDAKLFTPEIPADYTRVEAKRPASDEAALIKGLGNYAGLAGKYPAALTAATVTLDLSTVIGRRVASAKVRGETPPSQKELMQKAVEIGAGVAFYQKLASEGRSPEYFGKTVKPGEKDAVLARWKTEDGQWRVIYGDLRVETVAAQ
jgi:outer membrane lipoprotein-sorting protein